MRKIRFGKLLMSRIKSHSIALLLLPLFGLVRLVIKWSCFLLHRGYSQSLLVIQLAHLGDLIHTIPFLRVLKENRPNHKIKIMVGSWNVGLAEKIPYIDEVIVYDSVFFDRTKKALIRRFLGDTLKTIQLINKNRFEFVYDLRGYFYSLFLAYCSNAKYIVGFSYHWQGILLDHSIKLTSNVYEKDNFVRLLPVGFRFSQELPLEFPLSHNDYLNAENFLGSMRNKIRVGVFPSAPYKPRRWPAVKFAQLIEQLIKEFGCEVILFGKGGDGSVIKEVCGYLHGFQIRFVLDKPLGEVAAIAKSLSVVIANDTGPLHLMCALNVPTIALFGPGNHRRWWSKRDADKLISANVSCAPCNLESDICDFPETACMDKITVEQVLEKIKPILRCGEV